MFFCICATPHAFTSGKKTGIKYKKNPFTPHLQNIFYPARVFAALLCG
jgi:hypothetical protein